MKRLFNNQLEGKELFQYLVTSKSNIIARKKSAIKTTDAAINAPELFLVSDKSVRKTAFEDVPETASKVRAKFVGNSALWFDSQQDVLLPDCWNKTVKDGNGRYHLKDHVYKTDSEVGDVVNITWREMTISELGYDKGGTTQALIYESDVLRDYDPRIFNRYRMGKAKQHSIGLQYKQLHLAINDEDFKEEFALWNQYIGKVINQEDAEKVGYMWIVPEIKLVECSVVLMGANSLTPTIGIGKEYTDDEDYEEVEETVEAKNTIIQPEAASTEEEPLDINATLRSIIKSGNKIINL